MGGGAVCIKHCLHSEPLVDGGGQGKPPAAPQQVVMDNKNVCHNLCLQYPKVLVWIPEEPSIQLQRFFFFCYKSEDKLKLENCFRFRKNILYFCFLHSIDCAGILKLRNADIELKKGETDIGRKNTRVRVVFRVAVPQQDGQMLWLQTDSIPVECCEWTEVQLKLDI